MYRALFRVSICFNGVGHVMYEMCTGRVLNCVTPTEEDYGKIEDEKCRDVVKYIFKTKRGHFRHSIKAVSNCYNIK